ncbi:MAG: type II toxin-antitoxin system VapC family toxin [Aridibacter sp.]
MEKSIFDTGFLYAYFDEADEFHKACDEIFLHESLNALLPDLVLPELAHLILRRMEVEKLTNFLRSIVAGDFELVRTTESDLERAAEILEKYNDNNIDLVDAVIVAMAERLEIEKILTVDRRHFGVFRPKHCETFELLP